MIRTKIVATIGPASNNEDTIRGMLHAGLNVARINFSHGDHDTHRETIALLRKVAAEEGKILAIMGDLQGPKIRLGRFAPITLQAGDEVLLGGEENQPGILHLPHPELIEALDSGASMIIGDGEMELIVIEKKDGILRCRSRFDGVLKERKGINTPGTRLPIPSITEKDKNDLPVICELKLDYVALSFVREADDIVYLRELMDGHGVKIPVIAKIEKFEAIQNLESIATIADGLMVARGDLGLDMPSQQLPMLQKRIIRVANSLGRPVITATQMLESMTSNPRPTRAESSDVANAILDGSDAVMLSGETASGKYPVESVQMMNRIARHTEAEFPYNRWISKRKEIEQLNNISDTISAASCRVAEQIDAKLIITSTMSGVTAQQIARHRPETLIIAVSPQERTQRRLALVWGVSCLIMPNVKTTDEMIRQSVAAVKDPVLEKDDVVIITGGVPFGRTGFTNLIQVHKVA